jgi:hypothetical protein
VEYKIISMFKNQLMLSSFLSQTNEVFALNVSDIYLFYFLVLNIDLLTT